MNNGGIWSGGYLMQADMIYMFGTHRDQFKKIHLSSFIVIFFVCFTYFFFLEYWYDLYDSRFACMCSVGLFNLKICVSFLSLFFWQFK